MKPTNPAEHIIVNMVLTDGSTNITLPTPMDILLQRAKSEMSNITLQDFIAALCSWEPWALEMIKTSATQKTSTWDYIVTHVHKFQPNPEKTNITFAEDFVCRTYANHVYNNL